MNAERLLMLAEFLETNSEAQRRFLFEAYRRLKNGSDDERLTPLIECDSIGCALGWVSSVPGLQQAYVDFLDRGPRFYSIFYDMALSLFKLSMRQADFLFYPGDVERGALPKEASALDVATHIRAFVARGGLP